MSVNNVIINDRANKAILKFTNIDLFQATKIGVIYYQGGFEYDNIANSSEIKIIDPTTLSINVITNSQSLNSISKPEVIYYDNNENVKGLVIASSKLGNISNLLIINESSFVSTLGYSTTFGKFGYVVSNNFGNSYVDYWDYLKYCRDNGLPHGDNIYDCQKELYRAMNYIENVEHKLQGYRSNKDQDNTFPRFGVYINGYPIANDYIPGELIKAQFELASFFSHTDLLESVVNENIQKEKISIIETTYFKGGKKNIVRPKRALIFLRKLFKTAIDGDNALYRT